jgi:hypothetical protein
MTYLRRALGAILGGALLGIILVALFKFVALFIN